MSDVQEAMNKAVAQVATNFGAEYVKTIKETLSKKDKLASGALYESINSNVFIDDVGVHLEILALEYLKWVDIGRKPGTMPPVEAIERWVAQRRISGSANARRNSLGRFSKGIRVNKGRNKKGQYTSIASQQNKIAWAIAKSIQKKGIKAAKIMESTDSLYVQMQAEANAAAVAVANLWVGEQFAEAIRSTGLKVTTTY